ncbi:hypothetical protein [Gymnodinialimonas sp.]
MTRAITLAVLCAGIAPGAAAAAEPIPSPLACRSHEVCFDNGATCNVLPDGAIFTLTRDGQVWTQVYADNAARFRMSLETTEAAAFDAARAERLNAAAVQVGIVADGSAEDGALIIDQFLLRGEAVASNMFRHRCTELTEMTGS